MDYTRRARIVVVDDQATHNLLLGTILQRAGYTVALCQDAPAALAVIQSGCDCVVTDYQMPGMDGIELIQAARRHATRLPLFLLLTGSDGPGIAERARAAGAHLVINKPAEPLLILGILEQLCGSGRPASDAPKPSIRTCREPALPQRRQRER